MQVLEGLDARAQQGFGSIEDVQQPFFNPAAALPLFGDDSPAGVCVCVCVHSHTHTHKYMNPAAALPLCSDDSPAG